MNRFARRGHQTSITGPMAWLCLFLAGATTLLDQARTGTWPQTFSGWLWFVVSILCILFALAWPSFWHWRGERVLQYLERKYEETSPRRNK